MKVYEATVIDKCAYPAWTNEVATYESYVGALDNNEQATAWTEASERYMISAREYFYILRLALYHVAGIKTDSSYETAQAMETATVEVYECALDILNVMYKENKR